MATRAKSGAPASDRPTGIVTFLFSDIEGSTQRWERDRAAMAAVLQRHDDLMQAAIEACSGHTFKTIGDAFYQCLPGELEAIQRAAIPRFKAAGPAKIAAMRAAGHDPTTTPEAQRRRVATARAQRKAIASWRDDGSLDGVNFRRDILPKLQRLPVRVIAEAMGTTISHASKERNGHLIPHRRHWITLKRLGDKQGATSSGASTH
jgi:class 3 adenylate cyclase